MPWWVLLTLVPPCTGLIALVLVLRTARFIVKETGETKGLRDLATVVRAVPTRWLPRLSRRRS